MSLAVRFYYVEICFHLFRVSRCFLFRTAAPPPQTKTLKTKIVLLYRVRTCSRCGKVSENFVASFSFVLLRRFELMYIYANRKELEDRRLAAWLV